VLKRLIGTIRGNPKYKEIIDDYYTSLPEIEEGSIEDRYERVLSAISNLWVNSDKNPSLFKSTKDFEPILRRKNSPYRDHFIHSFNVFLLGYYIINKFNELYPDKEYFGAGENDWNLTWMLTSTFHDVAYPVQETETWLNDFFDKFLGVNPNFSLNIAQIIPPIYTDFMQMLSRHHKYHKEDALGFTDDLLKIDWFYYNELCSGLTKKNHGVLGALMLCHQMAIREGFLERPDPVDFLKNHLPACHAISLHALESIPVNFAKHPFAYLLILCDELQNWGRPSNRDSQDIIQLKNVVVNGTGTLKIQFKIEASTDIETMSSVLKKRLIENNSIEIEVTPGI
jgi:hypothetical protein